jgi:mitogen-activated protein kinase kinase
MLLRHAWLAPLMQPPTESGEDAPPEDSDSGDSASSAITADKEVADWVKRQIKSREEGTLQVPEKPALHAVALDKVGTSSADGDAHATSQND